MVKISSYIYSALSVIIIILAISIFILSSIYKKIITELEKENKSLIIQLSSAEVLIDMQNKEIKQYSLNMENAKRKYDKKIDNLNNKYNLLKEQYKKTEKLTCIETIKIIEENQRRFIYEK